MIVCFDGFCQRGVNFVNFSFTLIVDALILQAKFALLEGETEVAIQLLDQALLTAEEKDLTTIQQRVIQEQYKLCIC